MTTTAATERHDDDDNDDDDDPHGIAEDEHGASDHTPRTTHASPKSTTTTIQSFLPPFNFITLHYAYFIGTSLLASVVFYASSSPHGSISYVDSLFLVVSAITEAGLNTINLSQMTVWQQVMLCLLIIIGSTIWVSIWTVVARKRVFDTRLKEIVDAERERVRHHYRHDGCLHLSSSHGPRRRRKKEEAGTMNEGTSSSTRTHHHHHHSDENPVSPQLAIPSAAKQGRNAQFHSLTAAERSRLGGHEYRALRLLSFVVPLYSGLCHVLGSLAVGAWIARHMPEAATSNGANPWWAGVFFAVSAFNNSGMSLLDANVVPFQQAYFVLITMGFLILAGNTAYPLFLRLILWSALKVLRLTTTTAMAEGSGGGGSRVDELKATLEFILKYPRRVYTNLFPSRPTWWLFVMVVLTNGIDWMAFEVLNIGNPVIEAIPVGARILDGLFQALAVRSGGFYLIPISATYPGLQVLYVIMMYISVYPVVITMRHSNVYEERSLGIYAADDEDDDDDDDDAPTEKKKKKKHPGGGGGGSAIMANFVRETFSFAGVGAARPAARPGPEGRQPRWHESRTSFVSQQIRGQLAHDLWLLALAVLAIVTMETWHFLADPVHFSVFNVVFEVVSAYGCVGISVGLPNDAMSFAGGWHAGSKLVLCLVMLRGRHRGLPVALDRAVRLPGERLLEDEEEDWRRRRRARSRRRGGGGLLDGRGVV